VIGISIAAPTNLGIDNAANKSGDILVLTSDRGVWQPWSAEAVQKYQSQGRPVFVDFTASWCLSCQVNERIAFGAPEVQKAFADSNIVLMRADWTRYDDSITQTLTSLGRSGVPTYVLYVPGEKGPRLLPEVLTPGIVTNAISQLTRGTTQTSASSSN
jgi:thiol:disulfide interchange protein DsbD